MSRALNFSDIALLTENQKSELCNYMNYLIARNNALIGLTHFVLGLSVMGFATFYVVPTLQEITAGDEFIPVSLAFILWAITPTAFAVLIAALFIGWRNRVWNLPLYNFGVKRLRADFMMRYGLDISRLSVKEIWAGVVCEN